tara:strand:- start:8854 stop:11091 length:2238 start_codon:yes stop_codon:yes gene_type:complete
MSEDQGASYESKAEAVTDEASLVKVWIDALNKAEKEEKDWRDDAERALETYIGKGKTGGRQFNMLHSNVETICPAIYNSTPVPDVRRRYNDADKVAKVAGDMLERGLSYSIDNYDFDAVMKLVLRDGEIVGRGVPRVRYTPTFGGPIVGPDGQPSLGEDGKPIPELVYQEVNCDYVPWRYFRRGPGRTWKDIGWVAYGDFLTKDEVRKIAPDCAEHLNYTYATDKDGKDKKVGSEEGQIFQRALVWQIWDKDSKRVISICTDYPTKPLLVTEDPLSIQGFFPSPRPYQPVSSTDGLVPIIPYSIYEDLVLELNEITSRISKLVKQLRPRGIYGGAEAVDLAAWASADDGELVPASNIQAMLEGGGMERSIAWFPLEPVILALRQLVEQREQIKQTIYEVTGMSDIIRGATKASETATAQNIKQQWGSLRIQERQMEMARVSRDLFRMKAEIIAGKFQWQTLSAMTGIKVPTAVEKQQAQQMVQQFMQATQQAQQAQQPPPPVPPGGAKIKEMAEGPTAEEVQQLLADDITRNYRIDIETDSTIRADLTRNQQTMNLFLQGTAQFAQSMGPIVQQIPEMKKVALTIYGAFSRHFKLGKQAEDALDNALEEVLKDTTPPQQKPDPQMVKAQADQQMMQMKMQIEQGKAQTDQQMAQIKAQMEQMKAQGSAQIAGIKAQAESNRARADMQTSQQEIEQSQIDAQASQRKAETDAALADQKMQHAQAKMDMDMERQRVKIMADQFKGGI